MRLASPIAAALLLALTSVSANAAVPEYQLKAAYLYNFFTFTTWPPNAATRTTLCVLGHDPFGVVLDNLSSKMVHGAPLDILRITTTEKARDCRMLFIGEGLGVDLEVTLAVLKDWAVLTVAEEKDAARRGAVIGLVIDNGRVVFDINTAAAQRARLVLSSKLLRLARQVHSTP